jgi:D-alanyl-D-alanine-carboxypeptidase/D-alanyl-D-alanine-endopeptidase
MRRAILFLVAVTLVPIGAFAADRKAAVDKIVQPVVDTGSAPGVVVGVLEGGKTQVFGYGKGVGDQAPDASTEFEIGSVTKTFTTLALAEMVERKMVALEDPVRNYLPPDTIPPGKAGVAEIRLIDLATQSSGLPRLPLNMHPGDPLNPYADYTPQLLYEFLGTQTLRLIPNAGFLYSNLGMGLLGHALSLRYGKTYEQMITELVTTPLGLNDTRIDLTENQRKRLTPGHDGDGKTVHNWDFNALAGAGALRSTATDLLRYVQAQLDPPEKLKPAIELQHMERRKIGAFGAIALAWIIKPDGKIYWHNGGTAGYTTYVSFSPERKTGVVVLVNNGGLFMDQIGDRVEHLLAGDAMQPLTLHRAITIDSKTIDEYVGAYEVVPGVRFNITRQGDQLFGQLAGSGALTMYPEAKDKFFLRIIDATVDFERNEQGQVFDVVLHQNGRDTKAKRVPAQ